MPSFSVWLLVCGCGWAATGFGKAQIVRLPFVIASAFPHFDPALQAGLHGARGAFGQGAPKVQGIPAETYRPNAFVNAASAASSSCWRISSEMSRSLVVISAISMFSPARALRARDATPQLVTISSPNRLILL